MPNKIPSEPQVKILLGAEVRAKAEGFSPHE